MWEPRYLDAGPDFGLRGFVERDGAVIGWPEPAGTHNDYHMRHGTSDANFSSRWRQWERGGPVELDADTPARRAAVTDWLAKHG